MLASPQYSLLVRWSVPSGERCRCYGTQHMFVNLHARALSPVTVWALTRLMSCWQAFRVLGWSLLFCWLKMSPWLSELFSFYCLPILLAFPKHRWFFSASRCMAHAHIKKCLLGPVNGLVYKTHMAGEMKVQITIVTSNTALNGFQYVH